MHPIKKQDLARVPGMHHKKLNFQIAETPELKKFLSLSNLSYSKIRRFPPYIVEQYFEEIGEPEQYQSLVDLLI